MDNDKKFTREAIRVSKESLHKGGYPIGAVVVIGNHVVAEGISDTETTNDPTMHAEIDAIRGACKKLETESLKGAILYSSLEPCAMCFSACQWAGIDRIVYACPRSEAPQDWYMSGCEISELNSQNGKESIDITYITQFKEEALEIIKDWEKNN